MKVTFARRLLFLVHDARNFAARVYEGALEDNVSFLASGLTFDALLAAVPLFLLVLALIGHLLSSGALASQVDVHEYLLRILPSNRSAGGPDPFAPIVGFAEGVVKSRGTLGILGVPLFVWFSTRLFGSLRAALCQVFDTPETRSWLRGKLLDARRSSARTRARPPCARRSRRRARRSRTRARSGSTRPCSGRSRSAAG